MKQKKRKEKRIKRTLMEAQSFHMDSGINQMKEKMLLMTWKSMHYYTP